MAKSDSDHRKSERILISRFSALGDVAMTIPVVYSVCRTYPEKHFMMLTTGFASTLFINPPDNLRVMGVDTNAYRGIGGLRRLSREISDDFAPDTFIDLHGVLRTYIISLFLLLKGVKVSHIDKGRAGKRALTRARNKRMFPLISSRARYREVFYRQGMICNDHFDSLFDGGKAPVANFAEITPPKAEGDVWVAVAPFAKHSGKIYPVEQMREVVKTIAERYATKVFLLGGGGSEQHVLEEWESSIPGTVSLAGKRYGLLKELSLLSHCEVMVSMDSANMHMASLVGLKVVSVWGATHPYCGFMGWRQDEENAVQLNMSCRPCSVFGNKPCRGNDYYCMKGIPPEMIVNCVKKILDKE